MSALDTLISELASPQWTTRENAFKSLQKEGVSAIEALIEGTTHSDWRVRRSCADLMDHLADSRCVESLLRLLHDPIEAVRRLAVHALSCQGCKVCPLNIDIVENLITVIQNDSSIRVRRVAAHQLGCQPPDSRAEALLLSLIEQETDAKLLSNAKWALAQHQSVGVNPQDKAQQFLQWVHQPRPATSPLTEEGISREAIYGERG